MGVEVVIKNGTRLVIDDTGKCIASDCDFDLALYARWLMQIRASGKNRGDVAHIGGGLCSMARMMGDGYRHVVYEIEPALREFCPEGVEFIPGDWRDTLSGTYDIIVHDLDGDIPRETLMRHLNDGGVILPKV